MRLLPLALIGASLIARPVIAQCSWFPQTFTDWFVTTTPGCSESSCSGNSAVAEDPYNGGTYTGIYPVTGACVDPTYWWQKGFPTPWAGEFHQADPDGWVYSTGEYFLAEGDSWRSSHLINGSWGAKRFPEQVDLCGEHISWIPAETYMYQYSHCNTLASVMPEPGYYLYDTPNPWPSAGYPDPDWWVVDCRTRGAGSPNPCPSNPNDVVESDKVYIDWWKHVEPSWDPNYSETYMYGRWMDPRTGRLEGLGLVGWQGGDGVMHKGHFIVNVGTPSMTTCQVPCRRTTIRTPAPAPAPVPISE